MTVYALRLENGKDTAPRMRFADALGLVPGSTPLGARSGLRPDGGGAVAVAAGSMQVTVQPFAAWIDGTASDAQAGYPFFSDAVVTLAVDPGDATQARVDTVVGRVQDNAYDGGGNTLATVELVKGVPGAGAPVLPANSIPLRDVNVPAGTSVGTGGLASGNLGADRRKYMVALGGILPVASATERDALTPRNGMAVYLAGAVQVYNGATSSWDVYAPQVIAKAGLSSNTTAQNINDATFTVLTLPLVVRNSGGMVAGNTVTIPKTGMYSVAAGCTFTSNSTGRRICQIVDNTGKVLARDEVGASGYTSFTVANEVDLAAGQAVSVQVYQTSGGVLAVRNDLNLSYLNVRRVGD